MEDPALLNWTMPAGMHITVSLQDSCGGDEYGRYGGWNKRNSSRDYHICLLNRVACVDSFEHELFHTWGDYNVKVDYRMDHHVTKKWQDTLFQAESWLRDNSSCGYLLDGPTEGTRNFSP
jgi:hypothetical protein